MPSQEELPSRSAPAQSPYFKTTDIGVDRRVMSDRMAWDAIPELDELQEKEKDLGGGNPVVVSASFELSLLFY